MRKSFSLLALVFILTQFLLSQEILLRYQPEKGRKFAYSLLTEGIINQTVMGIEQVINLNTAMRVYYLVQNVTSDGNVELIISIDTIKTKMKTQTLQMDTTLVLPVGFKFRQIVDKFGKGISFEIIEIKQQNLPSGFEERLDKRSYTHSVIFPEKKIKPNDSWSFSYIDTTINELGQAIVKTNGKYTFEGVETVNQIKCARLKLDANFLISGQGTIQDMKYGIEGEGKNIGTLWVDLATGIVVRSDTNSEIEMAMGMKGQVEMTLPMSQKMRTVLNLIR